MKRLLSNTQTIFPLSPKNSPDTVAPCSSLEIVNMGLPWRRMTVCGNRSTMLTDLPKRIATATAFVGRGPKSEIGGGIGSFAGSRTPAGKFAVKVAIWAAIFVMVCWSLDIWVAMLEIVCRSVSFSLAALVSLVAASFNASQQRAHPIMSVNPYPLHTKRSYFLYFV